MDDLSETAKKFILSIKKQECLSSDLLDWIKNNPELKKDFKYLKNIIDFYSYNSCHILTYFVSAKLPQLNTAVFFGEKTGRPAHSALVLPSGIFFDAQGFRSEDKVFEQYAPICQEHRDEDLLPAKIMNRDDLIGTMIRVTKSFNSIKDVEESFDMRKGNFFRDINHFFDLARLHGNFNI